MTRLLIATTSRDKLREIHGLLGHLPIELLSLRDFPAAPEPDETGATFSENARIKALCYDDSVAQPAAVVPASAEAYGGTSPKRQREGGQGPLFTVAEDSGLVVEALGGEPGVYSARFVRPDATYPERFAEIYRRLAEQPNAPRTARFVCAVAVVQGGTVVYETEGTVEGEVAAVPHGDQGFGYDPIFYYPPYGRTLADVSEADKLRVAHRGQAFRKLAAWLSREGV
jgi:XTP/dITP diphosphohydrolase